MSSGSAGSSVGNGHQEIAGSRWNMQIEWYFESNQEVQVKRNISKVQMDHPGSAR
jgi:hypothetical protein